MQGTCVLMGVFCNEKLYEVNRLIFLKTLFHSNFCSVDITWKQSFFHVCIICIQLILLSYNACKQRCNKKMHCFYMWCSCRSVGEINHTALFWEQINRWWNPKAGYIHSVVEWNWLFYQYHIINCCDVLQKSLQNVEQIFQLAKATKLLSKTTEIDWSASCFRVEITKLP